MTAASGGCDQPIYPTSKASKLPHQIGNGIESIGSVSELHTKPKRNCNFKRLETELMLDWNGPALPKYQEFIEKSLDRHLGGRQNWRFKTGSSKTFCLSSGGQSDK